MNVVHDAVVIGSGAGGGPMAARLSEAGWDVLLLEKGPFRQRQDYSLDEVTATQRDFFVPSFADEPHVLVPAGDRAAADGTADRPPGWRRHRRTGGFFTVSTDIPKWRASMAP
jgi:choline dehydrogenase-like flavoprotein